MGSGLTKAPTLKPRTRVRPETYLWQLSSWMPIVASAKYKRGQIGTGRCHNDVGLAPGTASKRLNIRLTGQLSTSTHVCVSSSVGKNVVTDIRDYPMVVSKHSPVLAAHNPQSRHIGSSTLLGKATRETVQCCGLLLSSGQEVRS